MGGGGGGGEGGDNSGMIGRRRRWRCFRQDMPIQLDIAWELEI